MLTLVAAITMSCALAVALPSQAWAVDPSYGYLYAADDDQYTLVLAPTETAPSGTVTTPVGKSYQLGTAPIVSWNTINLSDYSHANSAGGVGSTYAWPWRTDDSANGYKAEDYLSKIKTVVVLDGVQLQRMQRLFCGLTGCETFDLSGLSTQGFNSFYCDRMFGDYVQNTYGGGTVGVVANSVCANTKVIYTGENWTMTEFTGLLREHLDTPVAYKQVNNQWRYATDQTKLYFTARNGEQCEWDYYFYGTGAANADVSEGITATGRELDKSDSLISGAHAYYTDAGDCTANADVDVPVEGRAQYVDKFTFTAQPENSSVYTTTSSNIHVQATYGYTDGWLANGYRKATVTYSWMKGNSTSGAFQETGTTNQYYNWTAADKADPGTHYYYAVAIATDSSGKELARENSSMAKVVMVDAIDVPALSAQPAGSDEENPLLYAWGVKASPLRFTVDSNDLNLFYMRYGVSSSNVTRTYQWYRSYEGGDWEMIPDANRATYTPPTRVDPGAYQFRCQMSYSFETYAQPIGSPVVTGYTDTANVRIYQAGAITGVPVVEDVAMQDAVYGDKADVLDYLTVKASISEGDAGDLTYQWFVSDDDQISDDDEPMADPTPLPADGIVSTLPDTTHVGESWYYCVVTNVVQTEDLEDSVKQGVSSLVKVTFPGELHLKSGEELKAFKDVASDYAGYTVYLDADVDLEAMDWRNPAINLTNIVFDGQGHTVSGVYATGAALGSAGSAGLFSLVKNSTVKNLTVTGWANCAGVVASADNSTIQSVVFRGTVGSSTQSAGAGGIVGLGNAVNIVECGMIGDVYTSIIALGWSGINGYPVGGLAAKLTGGCSIVRSFHDGTIQAHDGSGLVGWAQGLLTVEDCYNAGTIICGLYGAPGTVSDADLHPATGGLVGSSREPGNTTQDRVYVSYGKYASGTTIRNSFNTANLLMWTSPNYDSGVAEAPNQEKQVDIGAICMIDNETGTTKATVSDCYVLDGTNWLNLNGATVKTDADMKADAMVEALNAQTTAGTWKGGSTYPVLSWQDDGAGAEPVVTDQEATSFTTVQGTPYEAITLSATLPENLKDTYKGTLSYQWYKAVADGDDVVVSGATSATFTPPCDTVEHAGYYCVVTNAYTGGRASSTSATYMCTTTSAAAATTPIISANPQSASYAYGAKMAALAVEASAEGELEGTLSYQWYKMTGETPDTEVDTAIADATSATYQPPATLGQVSYYCVVTDTLDDLHPTASATSAVAAVTVADTVEVASAADLKVVSDNVAAGMNYSGVKVMLTDDIDLSLDAATLPWTPIGDNTHPFLGEFDGDGHVVSNMMVDGTSGRANYLGLIGYAGVSCPSVHDVVVTGSVKATAAGLYVSGVVGYTAGKTNITCVASKVDIEGGACDGGILGYDTMGCTISSCANYGDIAAASLNSNRGAGGIVGMCASANARYSNLYNRGAVSGTVTHQYAGVGGLVGTARTYAMQISDSYNAGSISSEGTQSNYTGAIIGRLSGGKALNCYYLEGSYTKAGVLSTTAADADAKALSSEELKSAATNERLNKTAAAVAADPLPWKEGATYPILQWEDAELSDALVVTAQPQDASYKLGAADVYELSFMVESAGDITYQWYANTTASTEGATKLTGAEQAKLAPATTSAGTTYYFCTATGSSSSVTSRFAQVFITSGLNASEPVFTTQPTESATYRMGTADVEPLVVAAEVPGEGKGELTYQWYRMAGAEPDPDADEAVEGATEVSFTPTADYAAKYYCVATNTYEIADNTAMAVSSVASIAVEYETVYINNLLELADFRDAVNAGNDYFGVVVELAPGIYDMAASSRTSNWTAVGTDATPFRGVFHGNGAQLVNFNIARTSAPAHYYDGFFAYTLGAEISDLSISGDVSTYARYGAGLLVGKMTGGSVNNVSVEGTVARKDGSVNAATITEAGYGGAVGYASKASLSDVFANVELDSNSENAGGIVGKMSATKVTGCSAQGTIRLSAVASTQIRGAGGIVGYMLDASTVADCLNEANVELTFTQNNTNARNPVAGGVVGYASSSNEEALVSECKNTGRVAGLDKQGGIAGSLAGQVTVDSCYNTGEVTYYANMSSSAQTGGLVGLLSTPSKVQNSYNTGIIIGGGSANGGLVGSGAGSDVVNCHYTFESYPEDPTFTNPERLDVLQAASFVATLNGEGGAYVINYEGTPMLWWETPRSVVGDGIAVDVADSVDYAGGPSEPEVTVTYTHGGVETVLEEGVDYTVAYAGNDMPGTATLTVTGMGDYAGEVVKTFEIAKGELTVTAGSAVKRAGAADPELSYEVEGLAGDDAFDYARVSRAAGENAGSYAVSAAGGIVLRGNSVVTDAYDVTYVDGALDIVDASALDSAIDAAAADKSSAKVSADGKDVAPADKWVAPAQAQALQEVIDSAKAVSADASATQAQVDEAAAAVKRAQAAFDAAKQAGTKSDDSQGGPDAPDKTGPATWTRFAGNDAYDTMNKIVSAGWQSSKVVVLANFDGYWDALTASGLAGFYNCPVLLTSPSSLSPTTASLIRSLGATDVVIAGGTAVVTPAVESQVKALGADVHRLAGDNAAGTARAIFEAGKSVGQWGGTAIVATGDGYWDALAASPYAYSKHAPIFLAQESASRGKGLDSATAQAIAKGGFARVVIVGGEAAVSAGVPAQLKAAGFSGETVRLAGDDAVDTSKRIAAFCVADGMSADGVGAATTDGYWDALTGAALCGSQNAPLILVAPSNGAAAANGFVKDNAPSIAHGYVFGGTGAVPASAYDALVAATK